MNTKTKLTSQLDAIAENLPDALPVLAECGTSGPWTIDEAIITDEVARFENLRATINGRNEHCVKPGTYRVLRHAQRGVVMSNTPMEVRTNGPILRAATGDVLINGLGLGMILAAIVKKPDVRSVTVIEHDPDVIRLVAPAFTRMSEGERNRLREAWADAVPGEIAIAKPTGSAGASLRIIHADALTWKPRKGVRYNAVWHDIWDDVNADNLAQMGNLCRRYARRSDWQGCWSRDMARRERARGY